jgi:hypothetical protein
MPNDGKSPLSFAAPTPGGNSFQLSLRPDQKTLFPESFLSEVNNKTQKAFSFQMLYGIS